MSNLKTLKPFKPGNDPRRNTKGRSPGYRNFNEILRKELGKKIVVNGKKVTVEEALVMRLIVDARKGKFWAYKMFMDYSFGKPSKVCPKCAKNENNSKAEFTEMNEIERNKKIEKLAEQIFTEN